MFCNVSPFLVSPIMQEVLLQNTGFFKHGSGDHFEVRAPCGPGGKHKNYFRMGLYGGGRKIGGIDADKVMSLTAV